MDGPIWAESSDILDLVHDSIIVRDMGGRVVQWNAAAEALYGWTRDEALGRNLHSLVGGEAAGALGDIEAKLHATGDWEGELARTTRDGTIVTIDLRWSLQRDEAGDPSCIVETGRDITDKRQAEESSRLTEYRYRNLFEAMAVAFWEVDFTAVGAMLKGLRDEGVTDLRAYLMAHRDVVREAMARSIAFDVNAKALQLFGVESKDDVVGFGTERFWPVESEPVYIESLVATMEKRPHYITETRMLTLQGEPIDVMFTVAWSPESRQSGIVLVGMIDIREQKRAFEALERSEQRYRNLYNFMPIALWQLDSTRMREMFDGLAKQGVTDLRGWLSDHPEFLDEAQASLRITETNEQTLKLFGAPDRETLLPLMADLWLDRGAWADAASARLSGARSYSSEATIRTLDGKAVEVLFSVAFADPANPQSSNLVGAIDISDRVHAEQMLRQVQADFAHAARVATLGELTASIAHEVNQPLAAIVTNGEASLRWLARPEPDLAEVCTLATRMVADARRAADIIARIRAMAGHRAPAPAAVDLNALIEESLSFLRHELAANGVTVALALAQNVPRVFGDRTQIQQVLVNLAVNAMQAMAQARTPEPRLALRTVTSERSRVRVEVEDNGPGIPADQVARLFESFFTTKPGGLGIGLSLSRSIVEAHGGEIGFVDTGRGALFAVSLPALAEPAQPALAAPAHTNV